MTSEREGSLRRIDAALHWSAVDAPFFGGDVTNVSRVKSPPLDKMVGGKGGVAMNTRLLIALLSGCFVAGESVAAELPLAPP
ncbi:MAG TPA: hypothetical protein VE667_09180, partial [Xanthobacteraceae bacterium]|nr:hypothetical protein [Xanthobacteraceae bacterium]